MADGGTSEALALLRKHRCCSNHCVYEAVRRQNFRALEYLLQRKARALSHVICYKGYMIPIYDM